MRSEGRPFLARTTDEAERGLWIIRNGAAWQRLSTAYSPGKRLGNTADKAIGRTRGGPDAKMPAVADGLGNPVELLLSVGNGQLEALFPAFVCLAALAVRLI